MNFTDFIVKHKQTLLLLLGVWLVAFGILSITSQTYPAINEFDPVWHTKTLGKTIEQGLPPMWDDSAYYPEGINLRKKGPVFLYFNVLWYNIASGITNIQGVEQELLMKTIAWSVPFFGALAVLTMFLLGRSIKGNKAGLFSALLLLVNGGFLYKAMFAETEDIVFGIFMVLLTLLAFSEFYKKMTLKRGLIAGTVMGLMSISWGLGMYVSALIATFFVVESILFFVKKEHVELSKLGVFFSVGLIPYFLIILLGSAYFTNLFEYGIGINRYFTHIIPLLSASLIISGIAFFSSKQEHFKVKNFSDRKVLKFVLGALVLVGALFMLTNSATVFNYISSTVGNLEQSSKLSKTVAEQHGMGFDKALQSLGILSSVLLLSFVYLPLNRLKNWKKKSVYLLPAIFVVTTFYMFMNRSQMNYIFTPALALAIGVTLADFFDLKNKFGKYAKVIVAMIITLILFTQIGIGIQTMDAGNKVQYGGPQLGWWRTFDFLHTTPENTAVLTWWDYGHWISFYGDRHAIVDNLNVNQDKVLEVAGVFTNWRGNATELEKYAKPFLDKWKVTHIGMDRILLYQKWGALTFLGDNQCIPMDEARSYGIPIPANLENTCGYGMAYVGDMGIASCAPKTVTSTGKTESYVECNLFQNSALKLTNEQWNDIKSAKWPGYDLNLGGGMVIKVYGQPDYKLMYFHVQGQILPDAPVNYMYGPRIFFRDDSFEDIKMVQNEFVPNEEVVLYEVV